MENHSTCSNLIDPNSEEIAKLNDHYWGLLTVESLVHKMIFHTYWYHNDMNTKTKDEFNDNGYRLLGALAREGLLFSERQLFIRTRVVCKIR